MSRQHSPEDQALLESMRASMRQSEQFSEKLDRQRRAAREARAYIRQEREELPLEAKLDCTADFIVEIKAADEDERRITGMATTPTLDRAGDIVDPMGARFEDEIPLFIGHDSTKVVGTVHLGNPTPKGVPFVAWIARIAQPGPLKRCDDAWQMVKSGLLKHVSIGFQALEVEVPDRWSEGEPRRYTLYEILELSLVPVPANPDAKISGFKSATVGDSSQAQPS